MHDNHTARALRRIAAMKIPGTDFTVGGVAAAARINPIIKRWGGTEDPRIQQQRERTMAEIERGAEQAAKAERENKAAMAMVMAGTHPAGITPEMVETHRAKMLEMASRRQGVSDANAANRAALQRASRGDLIGAMGAALGASEEGKAYRGEGDEGWQGSAQQQQQQLDAPPLDAPSPIPEPPIPQAPISQAPGPELVRGHDVRGQEGLGQAALAALGAALSLVLAGQVRGADAAAAVALAGRIAQAAAARIA